MDAVFAAQARRHWPMFAAVLVLAVFSVVHAFAFQPLADRYRRELSEARSLGIVLDPAHPAQQSALPVRVFSLLMANSLPAVEVESRSQSGTLGPEMVQALTSLAGRHGLEVVVAEPGLVTPLPNLIEVRAHLRLKGRYEDFVGWVDALARGDRLWVLERFIILPGRERGNEFEVWMGSCLLKRTGASREP